MITGLLERFFLVVPDDRPAVRAFVLVPLEFVPAFRATGREEPRCGSSPVET